MADIEPPSFSLGIDFDSDPETQPSPSICPTHKPLDEDEDEDCELRVSDTDLDSDPTPPPTRFRRLRRGFSTSTKPVLTSSDITNVDEDDDIQDFSAEEFPTTVGMPVPQNHSFCSSSKPPLSASGILASQLKTNVTNGKRKQDSTCPTSLDAGRGKSVFMDLTISPLRRFRLLDSDSDGDDPLKSVSTSNQCEKKESTQGCHPSPSEEKITLLTPLPQNQDLWHDFYADKSSAIPTPAFDSFCKEYYNASKERKQPSGSSHELYPSALGKTGAVKKMQSQDSGSCDFPCHRYFFHDDSRIQMLVRSRLSYFHPLSASGEEATDSVNPIDYMNQFGHSDSAKKRTPRQANASKFSGRSGKKSKETSNVSNGWVNPNQAGSSAKDAARRRVHADGQSSGHWFTSENGKKVYISKTGKELTGRLAYKSYKQENGKGFKRSRKKSGSRKSKEMKIPR